MNPMTKKPTVVAKAISLNSDRGTQNANVRQNVYAANVLTFEIGFRASLD